VEKSCYLMLWASAAAWAERLDGDEQYLLQRVIEGALRQQSVH
jgi:hypothetical protein